MRKVWSLTLLAVALLLAQSWAQECGSQAGGAVCPDGQCCSQYGWCGSTSDYCGTGCQSQCNGGSGGGGGSGGVGSIITEDLYNQMLAHHNDPSCASNGFYTYNAFITAAQSFSGFGTTGDVDTQKRELAAFFGQTSHETTGQSNFLLQYYTFSLAIFTIET